jgi:dipeptidyl aminopeptidase/acylaminoacyl peptidase
MFSYYSGDGDPLKALLYLPAGTDANHPVPVVTYTYEKLTPYRNRFDAEAQWYVSHGYGFLMPDVLIKVGHLSESYVKSVVPAVNAVRAMNLTTGRFGITGGSLGGLAGLSLISHTDIFTAAVLRAPPSDYFSTWGDGRDRDVWTIEAGQGRAAGTPWDHREAYIENSPFFVADHVHTPVLIVHGEADFTVPFQQGLMMFSALRALHRTADMLIYRDGEHSIVRGSRFRFIDFHEHTMEWWEKYLKPS